MPYDSNLDKKLISKSWEHERGRITVSVWSYNDGPKKIQLGRENKDREGVFRFTKLGRLTKEEAEAILPLLKSVLEEI
jgi:tRNA/tmRNA/rRNA uracil-C5-methylase (TrmA/RlmC/RlmD family)